MKVECGFGGGGGVTMETGAADEAMRGDSGGIRADEGKVKLKCVGNARGRSGLLHA